MLERQKTKFIKLQRKIDTVVYYDANKKQNVHDNINKSEDITFNKTDVSIRFNKCKVNNNKRSTSTSCKINYIEIEDVYVNNVPN